MQIGKPTTAMECSKFNRIVQTFSSNEINKTELTNFIWQCHTIENTWIIRMKLHQYQGNIKIHEGFDIPDSNIYRFF